MSGECDFCGQHGHVEARHCAFRGQPPLHPAPPPPDLAALAAAMEAKALEADREAKEWEYDGDEKMRYGKGKAAIAYRDCAAMVRAISVKAP